MKIFRCNVFERWWGEDSVDVPAEHIEEFKEVAIPTQDLQRTPWQDVSNWNFDMVTTEQLVWNGTTEEINGSSIFKVIDGEDVIYYHYAGYQRALQGPQGQPGYYRCQFIRDEWMSHQLYRLRNNTAKKTPIWFTNKHMNRMDAKTGEVNYMTMPWLKTLNTTLQPSFDVFKENLSQDTPYDKTKSFKPITITNRLPGYQSKFSNQWTTETANDEVIANIGEAIFEYDRLNLFTDEAQWNGINFARKVAQIDEITGSGIYPSWKTKKTWFANWNELDDWYNLGTTEKPSYKYAILSNIRFTNINDHGQDAQPIPFIGERIVTSDTSDIDLEYNNSYIMIVPWQSKLVNGMLDKFVANTSEGEDYTYKNTIISSYDSLRRAIKDIYNVEIVATGQSGSPTMSIISSSIKPSTLSYYLYKAGNPFNWYKENGEDVLSINNLWKRLYGGSVTPVNNTLYAGSQYANFFVCNDENPLQLIDNLQNSTNENNFFNKMYKMTNDLKNKVSQTDNAHEPILFSPLYSHIQYLIKKSGQGTVSADMIDWTSTGNISIYYQMLDQIHYKWDLSQVLNPNYELSSCEEELYFNDDRKYPGYDSAWETYLSQSATTLNTSRSLANTTLWQQQLTNALGSGLPSPDKFANALLGKSVNAMSIGINYTKDIQRIDSQQANLINTPNTLTLPPFIGALFTNPVSYMVSTYLTDLSQDTIGAYHRGYGYIVNKMMPMSEYDNRVEFNYIKVDASMNKAQIIRESLNGGVHYLTPFYSQKEFGNIYTERLTAGIRVHKGGIHEINSLTNWEKLHPLPPEYLVTFNWNGTETFNPNVKQTTNSSQTYNYYFVDSHGQQFKFNISFDGMHSHMVFKDDGTCQITTDDSGNTEDIVCNFSRYGAKFGTVTFTITKMTIGFKSQWTYPTPYGDMSYANGVITLPDSFPFGQQVDLSTDLDLTKIFDFINVEDSDWTDISFAFQNRPADSNVFRINVNSGEKIFVITFTDATPMANYESEWTDASGVNHDFSGVPTQISFAGQNTPMLKMKDTFIVNATWVGGGDMTFERKADGSFYLTQQSQAQAVIELTPEIFNAIFETNVDPTNNTFSFNIDGAGPDSYQNLSIQATTVNNHATFFYNGGAISTIAGDTKWTFGGQTYQIANIPQTWNWATSPSKE